MGSTVDVTVVGSGAVFLAASARERIDDLERRWSRFLPDSEVSRLNRAAGRGVAVSHETRLLVRRAVEGYVATAGRFDPTLLGAVLRAGYVESFEALGSRPAHRSSRLVTGAGQIDVDDVAGTVRLPRGVGFDPGGVGKGLAADLVADELVAQGADGACVNIGGDVRVRGASPEHDDWHIAIADPRGGDPLAVIRLADGGVATSSRVRRAWAAEDGAAVHHLIDPRSDRSAQTPVLAATAIASEAWRAEVLAKLAFLDGSAGPGGVALGLDRIDDLGAAALVVERDAVAESREWWRFLRDDPDPNPDRRSDRAIRAPELVR
jgi:thiamine biosynthesis lipoprotein